MLHRKKSYEIKSWKAKVKIFKYSMQNELEMPKGVGNFQFVSNWQSLSSSPLFSLSELGVYTAAYTSHNIRKKPNYALFQKSPQLEAKLAEPVHDL